MRKTLFLILLAILAIGAGYGQYVVNFEGATEIKASYISATVNLSGLDWDMTESLIGSLAADFYNGTKSARFNGKVNSSMTMLTDKTNGIGTLSFQYRSYGTDTQVVWKVEISTNQGSTWAQVGSDFTPTDTPQTFTHIANTLGNVRMRIVLVTNSGTTNKRMNVDDITLTDNTGTTPTIIVSGTLGDFNTYTGTASVAQSYNLSGSNLTTGITVTAPAGYELSADNTTFGTPLSLGSSYSGLMYVRLTGAAAGTFTGNITHTSTGANPVNLAVSGSVEDPIPTIFAVSEMTPFTTGMGTPSDSQQYTLTGIFLTENVSITAPTGYALSTDGTIFTPTLSVAVSSGTQIYVRLTGAAAGPFNGNITHTSAGAAQVDVPVSGTVVPPVPVLHVDGTISNVITIVGTPSASQSYTLFGDFLSEEILVVAPDGFEVSTDDITYGGSVSVANTFNGLIYVRLTGTTAGSYNGNIRHTCGEADQVDLAVSGAVNEPTGSYATDLFFSEYIEGGSNNKALEVYNGTGVSVDLSNYTVKLGSNGDVWGNTYTAPTNTMLAPGDVYIIANSQSIQAILDLADDTSTVTYYNGDDALGLFHGETQIDAIGIYQVDPGSAWPVAGVTGATLNHTIIRKPTVAQGNLDWTASAGTTADNSEWIVQAQDYITDLGSHTFTPGAQMVATPVISPASGVYTSAQTVTITCATADAAIYYTTDGSDPSDASTPYTIGFSVNATSTVKAIAYKLGFTPSAIASATYNFPTDVANIAALRASATGTTVYRLTGESVLTFQQDTSRHPKYIQDATAAIVIDDPSAIITSVYNLYDGITGITGTLGVYNGLLQFTPVADPGAATSAGNVIVPEVRTLASLTPADQAKLIKVMNATIDPTSVNFPGSTGNVNVTDASGTRVLRTFASTDYNGTPIPTVATDIVCLVGQFNLDMQISPRFLVDMTPSATGTLDSPVVTITRDGNNVVLNWNAVPGANGGYRIEADADPYGSFAETYTVATGVLTWSQTSAEKKFYRVVALP